jgi:hypothetical protein
MFVPRQCAPGGSMKHAFSFLFVAAVGLCAFGCTPPVEKTCERLSELADKEAKDKDTKSNFSNDKCMKKLNEMKERDADAYKCAAKMAKNMTKFETALFAISICDKNAPSKKSSDDDDDKAKKKKKSSDDE